MRAILCGPVAEGRACWLLISAVKPFLGGLENYEAGDVEQGVEMKAQARANLGLEGQRLGSRSGGWTGFRVEGLSTKWHPSRPGS